MSQSLPFAAKPNPWPPRNCGDPPADACPRPPAPGSCAPPFVFFSGSLFNGFPPITPEPIFGFKRIQVRRFDPFGPEMAMFGRT